MYAKNNCVFQYKLPPSYQYMRNWNKGYLEWSQRMRVQRYAEPILIHVYSEVLQKFRLAAQGKSISRQPPLARSESWSTLPTRMNVANFSLSPM